jgi:hypothetical protein
MRPDGGAGPYPYPAPCGWCRVWPGDWHRPATLELNPACPTHAPRPAAPAGQSGTNQALVYLLIVFGILSGSRGALLRPGPLRVKSTAGEVPVGRVLSRRSLPERGVRVSSHPALQ